MTCKYDINKFYSVSQNLLNNQLRDNYCMMETPIVEVAQGKLCGIKEKNVNGNYFYAFRGIPYAKAPVGKLRFKDPEPVEPWFGIKDAKQFGNVCAQKDWITNKIIGSDDCLYLNVYSNNLKSKIPKTVMVWIYGGGFISGSGNSDLYGPDFLVEMDVVLVTMNYRLSMLGFLNLDNEEVSGNQGLKDQVMALKWVKQNIAKFGGDPENVTIFGESAGAASVHYLTLSPLAQGLFHKAILQSGVATCPWASSPYSMKEVALKMLSKLGYEVCDPNKLVDYLREIDAIYLVEAEYSIKTWENRFLFENVFVPSVDDKSKNPFLSIPLEEAVKSGIKVPHIIGYTSHEGIIVFPELHDDKYSEIEANQDKLLLHPNIKQFLQRRNISVDKVKNLFMKGKAINQENTKLLVNLFSAINFVINIHHVLEIQSSISNIKPYLYKFDYYTKETAIMQKIFCSDLEGTCHAEDLFYLFHQENAKSSPEKFVVQQKFLTIWTNFAKTGNSMSFEWKPVDNPTEFNCLRISKDLGMVKESNILHQLNENS